MSTTPESTTKTEPQTESSEPTSTEPTQALPPHIQHREAVLTRAQALRAYLGR